MITIQQLLESMDLDFEPRFVTKGKFGEIWLWANEPHINHGDTFWSNTIQEKKQIGACRLKLSEFDGKDWTECIYEVPRKTTGKIEKLENRVNGSLIIPPMGNEVVEKINELIDAVNKHADIIQQIGQWGNSKGECLWCETLTKFEPNELKGE